MEKRKYSDRAEELKKAVAKRRKMIKATAIEYKGGRCCICGYCKCNSALDFHHHDEKTKSFGFQSVVLPGLGNGQEQSSINVCYCVQTATVKFMKGLRSSLRKLRDEHLGITVKANS